MTTRGTKTNLKSDKNLTPFEKPVPDPANEVQKSAIFQPQEASDDSFASPFELTPDIVTTRGFKKSKNTKESQKSKQSKKADAFVAKVQSEESSASTFELTPEKYGSSDIRIGFKM